MKNNWLKKLRQTFPLLLILGIGALLRLYRIRDYLVFLGDEGRDVLVVKRILLDHKFTLLGPVTSVGGMYLGPIYYYFMAPFLWLSNFDPVGPAIMVALFGIATIYLIYKIGDDFFDRLTGLCASLLYATSPLVIIYSRSSWNPNVVPFFSVLLIYSLLQAFVNKKWLWLFFAGLSFGVGLQLHYITLFFAVIFVLLFILNRSAISLGRFVLLVGGFISTFWPFLLFELRHNFTNTVTVLQFITRGNGSNFGLTKLLVHTQDIATRIFSRLLFSERTNVTMLLIFTLIIFYAIYFVATRKKPRIRAGLAILFIWFFVSILSYSLYQGAVYDYYFTPIFGLPFLLIGFFLSFIFRTSWIGKATAIILLIFFLYFHIKHSPFRIEPNRLLNQSENIAQFVFEKTDGKPYNFALISSGNSDHAYRYFLELWGNPPVTIENTEVDPQRKSLMEQLLIVCEDKVCQPLGYSLWEVAGFGGAEVSGVWDVFPVKIIRLVHYTNEKKS